MNKLRYVSILSFSAAISIILICIPSFCDWRIGSFVYDMKTANIENENNVGVSLDAKTLMSPVFKNSLLLSIGVSIPAIIDSFSDLLVAPSTSQLRVLLLLGIVGPNIYFFLASYSPEALAVLFQVRYIYCASICYIQLIIFGDDVFRCWSFALMALLTDFSGVFSCWLSFYALYVKLIMILYHLTFFAVSLLFTYFIYKWFKQLYRIPTREITNDQRRCSLYILAVYFSGCGFIVLALLYGPFINKNTSIEYLSCYTYVETLLIICIWYFHGRIVRLEVTQANVSHFVLICVNT